MREVTQLGLGCSQNSHLESIVIPNDDDLGVEEHDPESSSSSDSSSRRSSIGDESSVVTETSETSLPGDYE